MEVRPLLFCNSRHETLYICRFRRIKKEIMGTMWKQGSTKDHCKRYLMVFHCFSLVFHCFFHGFSWFCHGFSVVFHCFPLFFLWFFQRTGFQRTGNPSIFIVGHPSMNINGFPSMNINGFPSMNSLMVHQ